MKYVFFIFACATALTFVQCAEATVVDSENGASDAAVPTLQDTINRGEYLVSAIGCHDCHSPKRMGEHGPELIPELVLSGYQASQPFNPPACDGLNQGWALFYPDLTATIGPWGTSFAANLTSDPTGIGSWSLEQFMTAIREGKSKGLKANRDILPPMPWPMYRNLSDEDLASIFYYLKSTKPVSNVVPPPVPPVQVEG